MTRLLYTVSEVAMMLSISYGHCHRLLSRGDVPYIRQGRRRKVRHLDLQRYVDSLDSRSEARHRLKDANRLRVG